MSQQPSPKSAEEVANLVARLTKQAGLTAPNPEDPNKVTDSATAPTQPDANDPAKLKTPAGTRPQNQDGRSVDGGVVTQNPSDLEDASSPQKIDRVGTPEQDATDVQVKKASSLISGLLGRIQRLGTEQPTAPVPSSQKQANSRTADVLDQMLQNQDLEAILTKVGAMVMEHERGRDFVEHLIQEEAGVEQTNLLVNQISSLQKRAADEYEYRAEMVKHAASQQDQEAEVLSEALTRLQHHNPQQYDLVIKQAGAINTAFVKIAEEVWQDPELRDTSEDDRIALAAHMQEYVKQGAADAMAMLDAGGGAEGAMPPELEGAENMAPEELMQLIQMLVEQGQLDPAQAEQLMAELMSQADPAAAEQEAMMKGASQQFGSLLDQATALMG